MYARPPRRWTSSWTDCVSSGLREFSNTRPRSALTITVSPGWLSAGPVPG
jgi:hypothetical protein